MMMAHRSARSMGSITAADDIPATPAQGPSIAQSDALSPLQVPCEVASIALREIGAKSARAPDFDSHEICIVKRIRAGPEGPGGAAAGAGPFAGDGRLLVDNVHPGAGEGEMRYHMESEESPSQELSSQESKCQEFPSQEFQSRESPPEEFSFREFEFQEFQEIQSPDFPPLEIQSEKFQSEDFQAKELPSLDFQSEEILSLELPSLDFQAEELLSLDFQAEGLPSLELPSLDFQAEELLSLDFQSEGLPSLELPSLDFQSQEVQSQEEEEEVTSAVRASCQLQADSGDNVLSWWSRQLPDAKTTEILCRRLHACFGQLSVGYGFAAAAQAAVPPLWSPPDLRPDDQRAAALVLKADTKALERGELGPCSAIVNGVELTVRIGLRPLPVEANQWQVYVNVAPEVRADQPARAVGPAVFTLDLWAAGRHRVTANVVRQAVETAVPGLLPALAPHELRDLIARRDKRYADGDGDVVVVAVVQSQEAASR